MSDERWRRGQSRQRLLDAALDAIAEFGPSGVSGRKIAKAAGVHHVQIQQMFGSVDVLLESSLLAERDRYVSQVLSEPSVLPDPFAAVAYPSFWRAITQVVLDPGPIDLARLAAGGPVQQLEADLASVVSDADERAAIASAWVAAPLGFLVFESTFQSALDMSGNELGAACDRLRHRLAELTAGSAELGRFAHTPAADDGGQLEPPTDASSRLIDAAQRLLATRIETGVPGRELAETAGVNYGLVSHYFGSKSAVFDAALVGLHERLVSEAVSDDRLLRGPELFTRHRTFIRAWASRLVGGRPTPDFELVGLRAMIDATVAARGADLSREDAVGDALAAMSLGLGWAVLGPLPSAASRDPGNAVTEQMYRLHYWLLAG